MAGDGAAPAVAPRALLFVRKSGTHEAVSRALSGAGFEVAVAVGRPAVLHHLRESGFDLVVLEVTWSGAREIDLIHEIRLSGDDVPIIVLGAVDSEAERVLSFDLGADDYLAQPFSPRELVSRSRALLRRVRRDGARPGPVRAVGNLRIDLARHEVSLGGRPVDVTASEFRLLELLSGNPGRVFTRHEIMEHLWAGPYFGDGHPVDTHMLNLRRKIELDPTQPSRLLTVRGVGFRLVAQLDDVALNER